MLGLACLLASGCGVQVEIARTPTPAPTPRPRVVRFADATRSVASPRVIFRDDKTADPLPFMQSALNDAYLVQGHTLAIRADYEATWLNTQLGSGRIRLALYSRQSENEAWALLNADTQDSLTAYAQPGRMAGTLGVDYQPDTPADVLLRAEIEVSGRAADALPASASGAASLTVWVFPPPSNVDTDPEIIRPALGTLDPDRLLLDWRGWRGGPCALAEQHKDNAALHEACMCVQEKRYAEAVTMLAPIQADDAALQAQIRDQMGYLAAVSGDLTGANAAFRDAADRWHRAQDVIAFSISAQNDTATRPAGDDGILPQLERLLELSYQIDENPGRAIAESNYYLLAQDRYGLQDLLDNYYRDRNLPQADVIQAWLNRIDATRTP